MQKVYPPINFSECNFFFWFYCTFDLLALWRTLLALWKFSHFLDANPGGFKVCNSTNTYRICFRSSGLHPLRTTRNEYQIESATHRMFHDNISRWAETIPLANFVIDYPISSDSVLEVLCGLQFMWQNQVSCTWTGMGSWKKKVMTWVENIVATEAANFTFHL